jgi:Domain of unknown function DUF1828
MFNCETIKSSFENFSLVRSCDVMRNGMLRLETPFQYMDGSKIDVFVGAYHPNGTGDVLGRTIISDVGQTVAMLLDMHIKPWTTKRRKEIVSEICRSLDVSQDGGTFFILLKPEELGELSSAIVRLSQACIRVSDLALNQRGRIVGQFKEDVEEVLDAADLEYEAGIALEGRYNKPVQLDFKISGKRRVALVQTLSTLNPTASHSLSNELFRKWYDLDAFRSQYDFLTIYDSNSDAFREDDLDRMRSMSTLLAFPAQQDEILQALAA